MMSFTLDFSSILTIDDDQFEQLCHNNPDIQFERSAKGELIIMAPVGGESGNRELELMGQLWDWNRRTKLGRAFSSSTCFKLPSGAIKSPDASWILLSRWEQLTPEEQKKFLPLCPNFVVELRSESDSIRMLQRKMEEYLENEAQLGWLIDPQREEVTIYRLGQKPQTLAKPIALEGENILPGFVCELDFLW